VNSQNVNLRRKKSKIRGVTLARFLCGGLAAGTVLTLGEWILNRTILGPEWDEVLIRLGVPPVSPLSALVVVLATLLAGTALAALTIAGRRLFGSPPFGTLAAALVFWVLAFLFSCIWLGAVGILPVRLMIISSIWGLGESVLAALAAARVCRPTKGSRSSPSPNASL